MPYTRLLIFLFLAHILGDYYFQPQRLAAAKGKKRGALLLHCLLYGAAYALVLFPFFKFPAVLWLLLVPLTHAAVDYAKQLLINKKVLVADRFYKKLADERKLRVAAAQLNLIVFIADQLRHLLFIAVIAWVFTRKAFLSSSDLGYKFLTGFIFGRLGLNTRQLVWLPTVLLFLAKPSNVLIQNILSPVRIAAEKPEAEQDKALEASDAKGGRIIGTLERILIALFILLGQWSALGFTLAAKTLTRYNKIAEDKSFGEQYLIGTLLSVLLTIVAILAYKIIP
jgi:hypothetical protein